MNQTTYNQLKESVFLLMCGEFDAESIGVTNEFKDSSFCSERYEKLYSCMEKILDASNLDKDLEIIQECHFDIMKHICMKMFDYGWNMSVLLAEDSTNKSL